MTIINKWLLDTKERDIDRADLFDNLFCFRDDLYAINNHLGFDQNYKNKIYQN